MKKLFALLLCVLMLGLSACGSASEPEPDDTSEIITTEPSTESTTELITEPTTEEPTTEQTTREAIAFSKNEKITDEKARILAADLKERSEDIIFLFWGALPGDHEHVEGDWYKVGENPYGIYSIADLKNFTEKTFTKEYAQKNFYEDTYANGDCGRFYEKDGALFYNEAPAGLAGDWRTETTQVKSQIKDTLILTMDYYESDKAEVTWRLKWENGAWKMDCGIWGI